MKLFTMKNFSIIELVSWSLIYGMFGWLLGSKHADIECARQAIESAKTKPAPTVQVPKVKEAVVMRDARIICLAAILHRTERDNWPQMQKAMARSPNVCTVAEFLYPKSDIPERMPLEETEAAIQAVDNG